MGVRTGGGRRQAAKRPTLHDVAHAADVSVMTVSRALRGSENVADETRSRIFREVERLGYRPSFSARTLRSGESRLLSFLASNLTIPLHIEIVQGARDAAMQHGYGLMLQVDSSRNPLESPFSCDGDLIIDFHEGPVRDPARTVSIMGASMSVDSCGTDLPGATRDAYLYLHAAGYRKIALLQAERNTPQEGWREAQRQLGLAEDPGLLAEVGLDRQSIVAGVRLLLQSNPDMDAMMVVHTAGTPIALDELQRHGITIGSDLGFIGTEVSHSEWGSVMTPKMSSIRIPGYAIGWGGAQRLIERLRGDTSEPKRVMIPSELVIRQSTPPRLPEPQVGS